MKRFIILIWVGIGFFLQGCTYPEPATITQKDSRPTIGISGAPAGAYLFVDGSKMGEAKRFDGKNGVLLVEPGKHKIEVKTSSGRLVFSTEVFLSSSTRKMFFCR